MIYDCFTFFNELDLLEIRLNELSPYVDRFVLVEATRTHQGNPKPLHFDENKQRYSAFLEKITHVVVDTYPEDRKDSWSYENHQREMILKGLESCRAEDVILVSDLDEIPHGRYIKSVIESDTTYIFRQRMSYYFLNCVRSIDLRADGSGRYRWTGTAMTSFENMRSPQQMRNLSILAQRLFDGPLASRIFWTVYYRVRGFPVGGKVKFVKSGGWHFSFLGGVEKIIQKLEAYAHGEYNKGEYKQATRIEEIVSNGQDIFGRDVQYEIVKVDEGFPDYVRQNQDRYRHLIRG